MKVTEMIKLLDTEENKYGGATGKARELNLEINGDFVGEIVSAKLEGWGDGLVTDVTLCVDVGRIEYHDSQIRNKAINDFAEKLKREFQDEHWTKFSTIRELIDEFAEEMKGGGENR